MSKNYYIIDTSSLIDLNHYYPIDRFPSLWEKIENLVKTNRLLSHKEVFNEINNKDDMLADWAKKNRNMFKPITKKQIEIVKKILKDYPSIVKKDKKYSADPWIIALAIELAKSKQTTLFKVKRIVVTEEKLRGEKVRIPFICKQLDVDSMDMIGMFREEAWKF
jgi:hypothetical protein